MSRSMLLACLVLLCLGGAPAVARQLPPPAAPVILTVGGTIGNTNEAGAASLGRADLEALPQAAIATATPWTKGVRRFEGVRLSDLLAHLGAEGKTLKATALNDYKVEVPLADAERFGVLVAMRIDGEPMTVRDKGPLWLIYPLDDLPAAERPLAQTRMIWQLRSLRVE